MIVQRGCQIRLGPTACAHHRALIAAGHARPGNGGDLDRIEGSASPGMRRIVAREGNWYGKFKHSYNPWPVRRQGNTDKLERLGRYEVHLDRKLERTLSMLLRLKDLRQGAIAG
jgi:hypothetical protein